MKKAVITLAAVPVAMFAVAGLAVTQTPSLPATNPAQTDPKASPTGSQLGPARQGQPRGADERAAAAGPVPNDPIQALGHSVFVRECSACHGLGPGNPGFSRKPGTDALYYKYGGEIAPALEQRTDLSPEAVAVFVREGATLMPPFRKTEISDRELAALGSYLSRNNAELRKVSGRPKR